jgi:hypothetical protein
MDFCSKLMDELRTLSLSVDLIDESAKSLSDRKLTSIATSINNIQTQFYSFSKLSASISLDTMANMKTNMASLLSIRGSLKNLTPAILKMTLNAVIPAFQNAVQMNSWCSLDYDVRNYFTNNSCGINTDNVDNKIYRIMTSIHNINRDMNMLVVNPFHYAYFNTFLDHIPEPFKHNKFNIYAVYTDKSANSEIENISDKVTDAVGTKLGLLKSTTKAFDITFYRPVIEDFDCVKEFDIDSVQSQIRRAVRLTRKDGLFMTIIPAFMLDKKLFKFLYSYLKDVHVTIDVDAYSTLFFYGIRKNAEDHMDTDAIKKISDFMYDILDNGEKDELSEPVFYTNRFYPVHFKRIDIFRGRYVSEKAVKRLSDVSTLSADVLSSISEVTQKESTPLLPFSKGQLGMILTSGVLNGVVNEGDGYCHVIKGVVIKDKVSTEEKNHTNDSTVQKTVERNKVELTLLKPNGTFVTLS